MSLQIMNRLYIAMSVAMYSAVTLYGHITDIKDFGYVWHLYMASFDPALVEDVVQAYNDLRPGNKQIADEKMRRDLQLTRRKLSPLQLVTQGLAMNTLCNQRIEDFCSSTIHIFGDSHAAFSFGTSSDLLCEEHIVHHYDFFKVPFAVHWLGPITMHRVGRENLSFLDIRKFGVREGDIIIFVFGEIDVRCHIGKQRDVEGRSLDEIINNLTNNYMTTILANKNLYNQVTCIVFNVIPPMHGGYNAEYPFYGMLEDRIAITKKLNVSLKKACSLYNIPFLDVYNFYCNPDGDLNQELSDGGVHIGKAHNRFIKEKLLELITQQQ